MKHCVFLCVFLVKFCSAIAQDASRNIDPTWDKYYDAHPSGISTAYQGSDFISIARLVGFIPTRKEMKGNVDLLETVLLRLPQDYLNQMRIDGEYFPRTYKHNDYFLLYNKFYKVVSKETWDRYCPYLIPLMVVDGTVSDKE